MERTAPHRGRQNHRPARPTGFCPHLQRHPQARPWRRSLEYDLYTGNGTIGTYATEERYTFGLDHKLGGGHQVGIKIIEIRGRDGTQNDSQALLAYTYTFGSRATLPATNQTAAWNGSLLDQVAKRPTYLPMQVVAKRDTTITPQRLVAIDKTALPACVSIDKDSDAITAPLAACRA